MDLFDIFPELQVSYMEAFDVIDTAYADSAIAYLESGGGVNKEKKTK